MPFGVRISYVHPTADQVYLLESLIGTKRLSEANRFHEEVDLLEGFLPSRRYTPGMISFRYAFTGLLIGLNGSGRELAVTEKGTG